MVVVHVHEPSWPSRPLRSPSLLVTDLPDAYHGVLQGSSPYLPVVRSVLDTPSARDHIAFRVRALVSVLGLLRSLRYERSETPAWQHDYEGGQNMGNPPTWFNRN